MARGDVQAYIVGLFEDLLGPSVREARFPWALGDKSERTGRRMSLPFDAAWPHRRLIVEVNEAQHVEPLPLFDKPGVMTVSGVDRGVQRRLYDRRKRAAAFEQGFN